MTADDLDIMDDPAWQSWKQAARDYHANRPQSSVILQGRTWDEVCADADRKLAKQNQTPELLNLRRLRDSTSTLDGLWHAINNDRRKAGAPVATVEAAAFMLRDGIASLKSEKLLAWIAQLSKSQMKEIAIRLSKERWSKNGSKRVPPWEPDEIDAFIKVWRISR